MFLFTRKATVKNAANVVVAIGWSRELTGYLNKTYHLGLKVGAQLFDTPTLHWHFEADNLDKIVSLNEKMLQDTTYVRCSKKRGRSGFLIP